MKGFSSPPTTHYIRPLQMIIPMQICDHGITQFKFNLDYAVDFMNMYKEVGFFGFMHIKQYTHNQGANDIRWLDNEMMNFYKNFNENKLISSNTILVMFSDHGPRYTALRKSIKGLLQERNPFFSLYLPKLFVERYPNAVRNLKENLDTVSTPMDIHETLMDFIRLETDDQTVKNPMAEVNY